MPESSSLTGRPRVWVVNFTGHNYHLAQEFGDLEVITEGMVPARSYDRLLGIVARKLKDSDPQDYLLLSGMMILNFVAGAVWMKMHGNMRALVWDKSHPRGSRYREFNVSPEQIEFILTFPGESHAQS